MRFCIGFALITSVIDQENSGHPLNQSDVKLKKRRGCARFPPLLACFYLSLHWLFFQENFEKKNSKFSEPDHLKTSFPLFTFSLMLNHFFWIKSPSLFFLFFCFFFSFTADGVTVFCNMAEDESLFTGRGDYQFDVYRLMKKANKYVLFNCASSIKKIVVFTL